MGALAGLSNNDLYKAAALAEGYESVPVSIDVFLNDPYYLGQIYGDGGVYPYWMDALHKIYPNPIYSPYEEVCLSGDTEVIISDEPRPLTMAEIRQKYSGQEFKVFAYNTFTQVWEPAVAHTPMTTGVKPTYKVTLNNGKWFKATAEHPILGSDQQWHRADTLIVGQSLMGTLYEKQDVTITSIVECPPEPVYNFTVDHLHNFPLSCGVISHNCCTGAIGVGKTTLALIGSLYDLYHVILLKNPHKKYKLLPTTHIIFSLVTATMDLAAAVMANQLLDAMGASPFFCEHLSPKKGERLDEDMFPHHIGVGYGSRGGHNLGKAVIGAIIDEANFQDKVANQAVENYNTITRRMKSRFMGKNGSLPCRRWIVSSRTDSAAFLESHIDQHRGDPSVIIFEPAIWDVQKVKGNYSGRTFPVFVGSTTEQPRILTTDKEVADCAGYTIDVPIEYKAEFEDDLPKSLQDLAGVATRNGVNLIYNVEKLNEALCLENCMITDEPQLTLTGEDQLIDYYKRELPKGQYFVHLDAAKSGDRFGFAMSRVTEPIQIKKRSAIDGVEHTMLSPSVETPLAFGIKALPGSQIPFFKVRQFLCDLRSRGVNIQYVSCDGFQSVDMLQLLAKLGFKSGYESADRTKDPYLKLAENVLLGLHKMPKSGILKNELLNLQNLPKKVDHPLTIVVDGKQVKGGKDIADACCVSAFTAITASMTLSQSSMIQQMQSAPRSMSTKERQDYVLKNYFGIGV